MTHKLLTIEQAIEQAQQGNPCMVDMDNHLKIELSYTNQKLLITACRPRSSHQTNLFINVAKRRYNKADQFGDIKIGADQSLNLIACKKVVYRHTDQVKEVIEVMKELLC